MYMQYMYVFLWINIRIFRFTISENLNYTSKAFISYQIHFIYSINWKMLPKVYRLFSCKLVRIKIQYFDKILKSIKKQNKLLGYQHYKANNTQQFLANEVIALTYYPMFRSLSVTLSFILWLSLAIWWHNVIG